MPEKFKVVISGMSGRFPECDDVDTFQQKLFGEEEFITVDDRKWPVGFKHERLGEKLIPDATGKFLDFAKYDQTVFKLNKTFALSSDITNRKILEPSFEAIIDAGINPYSLDGTNVSVFMSTGINDVDCNVFRTNIPSNILCLIGANKTMLSNRVSYALNLTGPSVTNYVDAHGGLDSLTMGYKHVSEGLAEAAIVGVASSIVDPRLSLHHLAYGMLSPDGVTRPFDEFANGYARSEAVVCFYLQRAEDAKRNYGEIVFCDSRYLGSELPIFINYGESYLKTCMQQLLGADSKLKSNLSNIGFLEMNACGHKVLDKIESNVVAELIAKNSNEPLMVGSIKSNIGHVETAAGLMAVLKALFVLDSGTLVPNRHFQKSNDDIEAFKTNQLQVVTEKCSLPGSTVAVNSHSLFGTVGLAIIKQHEKAPGLQVNKLDDPPFPRLLLICGRQENDLKAKLTQIEKSPFNAEFVALANDAFRQHMPLHIYRGFALLPPPFRPVNFIKEKGDPHRPVWFIFSGMGSQWIGMGKSLLRLPLFAETVVKCDKVLRQKNIDIYHILTSDDSTLFDDIVNAFVGIITVQIGLYEVVKALGIKADGIIGHSVGENACAYADGCLSLEQAVLASWARGVASNEVKTIKGMMAAVGKGYEDMKDILPEDVFVACHNSADSCTLSGPAKSVESYVGKLKENGVFAKAVNVANIAYHSKYIASIAPKLLCRLERVIKEPKQRSSKWISTSVPENKWYTTLSQYCSAEYLTNNLLSPVLFEEGCKHIPANAICIEIAPHGLLQAILKRSLPDTCTNISLTNRGKIDDNLNFLLSSIGMLYVAGLEPDVNNIYPTVEYPVSRGTPHLAPYCTWYHQDDPIPYHICSHHKEDIAMGSELVPICVRDDSDLGYLKDHRVNDNITIPPSFFIFLTWKMFLSEYSQESIGSSTVIFEEVRIHPNNIFISSQDTKYASVMVQYGSGNFQVMLQDFTDSDDTQIILMGRIHLGFENITNHVSTLTPLTESFITKKQFYNMLEHAGYNLGEEFSLVNEICCHETKYKGGISWNGNWVTFLDALMKVQMFADNNKNITDVVSTYIRRLEISTSEYQSFVKGTVIPYGLDTSTKELYCPGLVMHALKYKTSRKFEAQLTPFRFVPFPNPRCQNILEFLHLSLQIATESLIISKHSTHTSNLVVLDTTGKYRLAVEQIASKQESLKSIEVLSALEKRKANEYIHILMITDRVGKLSEIDTAVESLFVLLISPATSASKEKYGQYFTTFVQQSFSAIEFTLLKMRQQDSVNDRNNGISNKINNHVSSSLVLSKNPDVDDVSKLMKTNKVDPSRNRYLYIMDEIVNKKKLDELVRKQIELDLPVSALKQGELGSYRSLIQKNYQSCINETTLTYAQLLPKISAGPIKRVKYVCFDGNEDIPIEQVSGFSYVAAVGTTEQEMGLAAISQTSNPRYDPYLQWMVPNNCCSEEAAIMIHTYAQAYKLLVLFPSYRLKSTRTVMINVGTEYSLAEAFVVLSLHKNLEIFITVDSDADALSFRNRFPEPGLVMLVIKVDHPVHIPTSVRARFHRYRGRMHSRGGVLRDKSGRLGLVVWRFSSIQYDHIFRSTNSSYIQIKRRWRGKGVDLMVNCLPGIEHVENSMKCLAINGVYVEVGTNNCLDSNYMGLYPFQFSTTFHTMRQTVSDFLELSAETRRTMRNFIENCLKKHVISPLKLNVESIKKMKVTKCYLLEDFPKRTPPTIKFDGEHSYLILGSGVEHVALFELVEWLIDQGARKLMIALEKFTIHSRIEHRLNRILARANGRILFTSASKLDDKLEAGALLKQIELLGPLEAAFFVAIKGAGKKISNLNDLVSPDMFFIGLSSAGLKEFEQRRAKGSPAILFHSDETNGVMSALPRLNELLARSDNNNAEILYHVTNSKDRNNHSMRVMHHFNLSDYLPHNMEILSTIGQEDTVEPAFVEMSSLSKRYVYCKGVYPIFALPAVHSLTLQPLFKQLHYPVFSATSTSMNSVKEVANKLYSALNQIQSTGPITMISETWTLPLALELISCARRDGRHYKIFILEGIPAIWSDRLREKLQSVGLEKFDVVCAEEIFHFIKKSKTNSSTKFVSFENDVRILAESASCDLKTVENVIRAAKKIKRTIMELSRIQFSNEMLEHVIWFERHRPNDRTLKLSVTSEVKVLDEPTYGGLLNNPEVGRMINKYAQFSWWEYTKPECGQW